MLHQTSETDHLVQKSKKKKSDHKLSPHNTPYNLVAVKRLDDIITVACDCHDNGALSSDKRLVGLSSLPQDDRRPKRDVLFTFVG